jgi:hypothetical protein
LTDGCIAEAPKGAITRQQEAEAAAIDEVDGPAWPTMLLQVGKEVFRAKLQSIAAAVVNGPDSQAKPATCDDAHTALASLIGTVTMARAMGEANLARSIAEAMRHRLLQAP